MQDIYYHRPRGLSTVFAKKFKIFFAKQKKVLLPPSGGGRRSLFSAADRLLARAALRPGVPLRALRCPRAAWGVPVRPGAAPVCPAMPPCAPAMPHALCGAPCALRCPPCALRCPPCALRCPLRALRCPLRALGLPYTLRVALLASVSLAAHHAPQYRARLSPPRGGPLPRPAAALSPAPRQLSPPPRGSSLLFPARQQKRPGRSKRSGRALFISLSGDEAQVSDQALGLPNWQSLLPESEVHISSMFRGSL